MSWASIHRDVVGGRAVHVKRTLYDPWLEAEGLAALRAAGAPVPEVLEVADDRLVLETVEGDEDWASLGRSLAGVHRSGADRFGWDHDNVIGSLPQSNPWTDHWPTFYIEHRLRPWMPALPPHLRHRLESACEATLPDLLDHGAVPSLVHGDLWSGNVIGWRWMIDPAVHHADREVDLAMLDLFGRFPPAFLAGYTEVAPLADGSERRRQALQLVPLLVHVRLFGAGYLAGVEHRLGALGW